MTREEWAKVEKALSGIYGQAKLKVEDCEITFQRQLVDKNKLGIMTFVDGHFLGVWFSAEKPCPEQKFLRPCSRFTHKPKTRAELKKLPKKTREAWGDFYDPDRKWNGFSPFWPNVTAIRRHYQKSFQSIELIEVLGC
jgi:hypothetical protein